ncbi:DUF1761 domain-containing protein [Rapidithrix thailandica]|uniref:DUF1761 domain-containing protein n=1 Tax=Rapidithrix thailandica TaxID=413964 RepID=A0AAW9SCF2_9BACT
MISQFANLNWIGIIAAFVPYFLLGALWFTLIFSKPYKISLGKENEELPQKPIFIIGPALCCLVITLASAILIYTLNISSYEAVIEFSLIAGIGFLVANTVNIAINPNIPQPILYGIISGSYHLVGILMVGIILVAMK